MKTVLWIYGLIVITVFLENVNCFNYNISVIHFSDFHARYEPVTNISTTCKGTNCIGGFSRLYSAIMQLIKDRPNSILLNAGDNFIGSLWYIVHRWNVTQHFLNKLPFDAITLGNHEFDDGIAGLVPFMTHFQRPIVVSNIDDSKEPRIRNLYNKSITIDRGGKKIGIIGVILASTSEVSHTENLIFENESISVNAEAKKLIDEGVFTTIVLSHCGYDLDLEIARSSTTGISLIVGGHTDTFLYTGTPVPGPDKPSGGYPTVVLNKNGNKVLVVQASAYTKYLGNLTVAYDDFGNVIDWHGAPIFLEPKMPTDTNIDDELRVWQRAVDLEGNKTVGESLFQMPNKPCRAEECLLGNFATDAMVYSFVDLAENNSWTYASIAMIHAGGMRAGIEKGSITYNGLTETFPFQDTVDVFDIKGNHIKKILETSVDNRHLTSPHLFQVSGLRVIFNISQAEGHRVKSLRTRCRECNTPIFELVISEKYYRIILPAFLSNSAFNPLFKKYLRNKRGGPLDVSAYIKYLSDRSPLFQQIEDRILFTK